MVEKILYFNPVSKQEIIDFQNEILSLHNARYIFLFAKYVNGADISLLSDGIIKTNDKKYIHYFARSIKGIDYTVFLIKLLNLLIQNFYLMLYMMFLNYLKFVLFLRLFI